MRRHTGRGHAVLVGFGVAGVNAAKLLIEAGTDPVDLTVVDLRPEPLECATALGAHAHLGDATEPGTLGRLVCERTGCVIVTIGPDASAIMATMLVRTLSPDATVVTAIRDGEHAARTLRAGADQVIATAQWTGRALARALD